MASAEENPLLDASDVCLGNVLEMQLLLGKSSTVSIL